MRRLFLLAKATELQAKIAKEDDECITQTVIELEESGWKCEKVTEETEESFIERIKCLRDKYSIAGVSETAKLVIIKAIGLSKDHWYKCLNGHYYAIGECGGANETGECPECNAVIGGASHTLAARTYMPRKWTAQNMRYGACS